MSFRLPPPSGAVLEALSSPSKDVGQHVEVLSIRKLTLASMVFSGAWPHRNRGPRGPP